MEQLVIFLLFIVASIVSSIIQKKKKAEEEEAARREMERSLPGEPARPSPSPTPSQPPVVRWPRSAQDWQEQLRKMLEESAPPVIKPVIKPVVVPEKRPPQAGAKPIPVKVVLPAEKSEGEFESRSPLRESASAHQRAASLHARVEDRLRAVDARTAAARPNQPHRRGERSTHAVVRNIRQRPAALREAFIASLIFSRPKSLEEREKV